MKIELKHGLSSMAGVVADPIKFSATPVEYNKPPPLFGEGTKTVLRQLLGKDETEIARLLKGKVI